MVEAILDFYDQHYLHENGKLRIEPASALETWFEAIDPLPEIAGLHYVLNQQLQKVSWRIQAY